MAGNPKTSPHYSTPQASRKRPKVGLTLSPEAVKRLEELSAETGLAKSVIVETLIKQADPNYFRGQSK